MNNGSAEVCLDADMTGAVGGLKKPRGTVTADAEITAMAKISKIMNSLDADDHDVVVNWFASKFISE